MAEDDIAAEAPPLTAFPWRGFYGGAVQRIVIEYDDHSSRSIGLDSCASIENAQTDLLSAASELVSASIGDYGLSADDGDDEPVAMTSRGGVFVKFGMLRRALKAINRVKGIAEASGTTPPVADKDSAL